jgi:glutathione peroxidase
MKKFLIPVIFLVMLTSIVSAQSQSIYSYKVKDINGGDFDFAALKGKKILIVNTASKCGFTPQYADLEKLYNEYKDKNLVIIGFPANNFMKQEPGTDEEIMTFCSVNYGVTFPMMSKISVKGSDMAPIYEWLTKKELNGVKDSDVSWNFQKYLIDENGKLVEVLPSKEKPYSEKILSWLNN